MGEVLLLCALSITTMIASYFAERSNRKSFIQRKLIQVGAVSLLQHITALTLTDLFSFSLLNLTGSYKAEGRHAGEEEGKR